MIPKLSPKNEVVVRYTLSEKEYLEAIRFNSGYGIMVFNNLLFIGLILLAMYFFGYKITVSTVIGLLVLQSCIALFFTLYAWKVQKKFFRENEIHQNEVRLRLLNKGIHFDYATGHGLMEWSHFSNFRCNTKYCLFFAEPATTMIIPLRALEVKERAQFLYFMKRYLVDNDDWCDDEDLGDSAQLTNVWSEGQDKAPEGKDNEQK